MLVCTEKVPVWELRVPSANLSEYPFYFQFCSETDVFNMKVQIFITNRHENSRSVFGSLNPSLALQWFYNYYWLNCPFQYLIPLYFADQGRCFSHPLISDAFYRYLLSFLYSLLACRTIFDYRSFMHKMNERVTLLETGSVERRENRALRHWKWNLVTRPFAPAYFVAFCRVEKVTECTFSLLSFAFYLSK